MLLRNSSLTYSNKLSSMLCRVYHYTISPHQQPPWLPLSRSDRAMRIKLEEPLSLDPINDDQLRQISHERMNRYGHGIENENIIALGGKNPSFSQSYNFRIMLDLGRANISIFCQRMLSSLLNFQGSHRIHSIIYYLSRIQRSKRAGEGLQINTESSKMFIVWSYGIQHKVHYIS